MLKRASLQGHTQPAIPSVRERVTAGIRNARANGKQLGRPKSGVDRERILQLKALGHSLRQIATTLGVGYGTVRARLLTSHKM